VTNALARHRGLRLALALAVTALVALVATAAAPAVAPKTTLGDVEPDVMCVSCNVALNVAESPQADRTRVEIKRLIAQGLTKKQIEDQLVKEYGPRILALPSHKGFNLAVYWVPIAVGLLLVGGVAFIVPRWVRRGREARAAEAAAQAGTAGANGGSHLSVADERRLDAELERFDA
jgi:cytochrome c-type biogenesis protein CcmH/NrfF